MSIQTITRKGSFDSGHRVVNESFKCFNIHGHTYLYELTFAFTEMQSIGYQLDFKELKRVGCQWIDDVLDHGMILNPHDKKLIEVTRDLKGKLWLMSLNGADNYCNPTAENIAKEIFLAQQILFESYDGLSINQIRLYETPNCYTDCTVSSITLEEKRNFLLANEESIKTYAANKGIIEYDDRKQLK